MTVKILNTSTNNIISISAVRPANDYKSNNLRDDPLASPDVIKSLHDDSITNTADTTFKYNELPSSPK